VFSSRVWRTHLPLSLFFYWTVSSRFLWSRRLGLGFLVRFCRKFWLTIMWNPSVVLELDLSVDVLH
jgi:hypothetical protein